MRVPFVPLMIFYLSALRILNKILLMTDHSDSFIQLSKLNSLFETKVNHQILQASVI